MLLLAGKGVEEEQLTIPVPKGQSLTCCNVPVDTAGMMVVHSGAGSGPGGRRCRHWALYMSPPHSRSSSRCLQRDTKTLRIVRPELWCSSEEVGARRAERLGSCSSSKTDCRSNADGAALQPQQAEGQASSLSVDREVL